MLLPNPMPKMGMRFCREGHLYAGHQLMPYLFVNEGFFFQGPYRASARFDVGARPCAAILVLGTSVCGVPNVSGVYLGGPKIALRGGGGGGWHGRPAKEGARFQKWTSVPGPLFCVTTVVATKGAGTQILARKIFFTQKFSPTYV